MPTPTNHPAREFSAGDKTPEMIAEIEERGLRELGKTSRNPRVLRAALDRLLADETK